MKYLRLNYIFIYRVFFEKLIKKILIDIFMKCSRDDVKLLDKQQS